MLVALLVGCGGDDEESVEPTTTAPALTVPGGEEGRDPEVTITATSPEPEPPPSDTSGGSPAPPAQPEDSPENDTPPPPGSPAERFEQFCDANPGACG